MKMNRRVSKLMREVFIMTRSAVMVFETVNCSASQIVPRRVLVIPHEIRVKKFLLSAMTNNFDSIITN